MPLDTLARLCVRGVDAFSMFSLVGCLPSMTSSGGFPLLFGQFVGITQPSDSPPTFVLGLRLTAFSNRPDDYPGIDGVSRFSRAEFPCMPGVSDCAESYGRLR